MELVIDTQGVIRCIYAETIPLHQLGAPSIRRASQVEPNEKGQWMVDLGPVNGPCLGPFEQRSQALAAEHDWLRSHWLPAQH